MKRILILTAGYGEGHNAAARALATAVKERGGEVEVRDVFLETYGETQQLAQRLYVECINRAPRLWGLFYGLMDRLPVMKYCVEPSLYVLRKKLERDLRAWQPDAVVSVYPSYGYTLDRIFPKGGAPFRRYMLVTDSVTINSIWHRCSADAWIVPNEASATVMRKAGLPAEKVHPLGFPVPPVFADTPEHRRPPGGDEPLRVLYMVNHNPEEAPGMVRSMLDLPFVELIVAGGRNASVLRAIERAARRPIELHGWTNRMPELLMRSHVLIGKAGGAATQEAIAAKTPMLVTKIVPGQEEGNATLLTESGCGSLAFTRGATVGLLAELHAEQGAMWKQWREAIGRISHPNAARDVAAFVMGA